MVEQKTDFVKSTRSTETAKSSSQLLRIWYAQAEKARLAKLPVAWCMVGLPPELVNAFEFAAVWPENYGTVCASRQLAVHFCEYAENEGFTPDLCSYERNYMGYAIRYKEVGGIPPEAPMGGLPEPAMILAPSTVCDPRSKGFQATATRYFHVPIYICDMQSVPPGVDMNDERVKKHYINHNTEQLRGLVTFLEKNTGNKLDEDKLRGIVERSLLTQRTIWDVHQLRRAVPSPMPSEDQFACVIPQLYMAGSVEALEFYRRLYDEVKQRVTNKVGVISNEKFRLLWMGIPPWFNMGFFNYLESQGAVSAMETTYYVYAPVEVDLSDPVRALAEAYYEKNRQLHQWGAEASPEGGTIPAGLVLDFVKEYQLDGVIMHKTLSCRAIAFGQAHTQKRLRDELKKPVLTIESDMADPRTWSDAHIKMQTDSFLDMIRALKGTAKT